MKLSLHRIAAAVCFAVCAIAALTLPASPAVAQSVNETQTVNATQRLALSGLLTANGYGKFVAAAYSPDGTSLYLLLDEHDGVRLLQADAAATTLLAQAHLGAAGDAPIALALNAAGDVFVTGTSTSGALTGTQSAAFPARADTSTNSFLAKFSASLNLQFVTFLGAGRTAVTGLAVTPDAEFVTGLTFNSTFPATASGVQQTPAAGTTENGFVERFSADGSTLVYATYLTGEGGITAPAAIAADSTDSAYIAGYTSATGYPTFAALVPEIIGTESGFLSKLNASGSAFTYSTFIPGGGITSLVYDSSSTSILLTGNVAIGDFPVTAVSTPLAATAYQTLVKLPSDGQSITSSLLMLPAASSLIGLGTSGDAWVSAALSTPLFPGSTPPLSDIGDSAAVHITSSGTLDQTARFGGQAVSNSSYSSLTSTLATPAISPATGMVSFGGSITTSTSPSLLATQRYDLPLAQTPTALLTSTLRDATAQSCANTSQCNASAAYLAQLASTAQPSLAFSVDTLPNIVLRNLGSAVATGLALTANGYAFTSDCGSTLAADAECDIALSGSGQGSVTASASNTPTATATFARAAHTRTVSARLRHTQRTAALLP